MAPVNRLSRARRVVIKIGSALLADESGGLHRDWLAGVCDDIAMLRESGKQVIVVSSGAIALGRIALGLRASALRLDEAQAAAAVGQIELARAYQASLAARGIAAAQLLLTWSDTEERRRYLNARNTVSTLLRLGAVPIINENDTVTTSEIRYGDNDRLAARVASMSSADCLILLSTVDGMYTMPPDRDPGARHIPEIDRVTPEIEAMAGDAGPHGTGGMVTKLEAARIATKSGCHMAITDGRPPRPVRALERGARATWFVAETSPGAARKRWIAATLKPRGRVIVDEGAEAALRSGKSLLPAGVTHIEGAFERGDAVAIVNLENDEIARGLTAYDDADARLIAGRNSREIETILGYRGRSALVHRDDLVVTRR
jgi:glutamate 5-kinase